jgi:type II secretory pathway pseudopilin PulG
VLRRLRSNEGFGLVELIIAMVILNIGLLALLSAIVSGQTALRRASHTSTAAALADAQIELYRAITYSAIALDPSTIPSTSPYTTDSAYSATQVTATCSGPAASNPQCNASRLLTGPDHVSYRVDTYITVRPATSIMRETKLVTVVVRDGSSLSRTYLRQSTAFDASTGS